MIKHAIWMLLALLGGWAGAHPIDEYLQAAYLKLSVDGLELELDLTAGEQVAPEMLRQIDQNRDRTLSQTEIETYANKVLEDLSLKLDGKAQALQLKRVNTPQTAVFLAGGGTIQLVASARWPEQSGRHTLEFANPHQPVKSAYLANAFVQSEQLEFYTQSRNNDQSEYRLEYGLAPAVDFKGGLLWILAGLLFVLGVAAWVWLRWSSRRHKTE